MSPVRVVLPVRAQIFAILEVVGMMTFRERTVPEILAAR